MELRRKQMKIMITIIVTFIIVAIFQAPTSAAAQRTLAYDSQGNFSGTATTRGNVGTTYDHHGRFESRAIKRGNSVHLPIATVVVSRFAQFGTVILN